MHTTRALKRWLKCLYLHTHIHALSHTHTHSLGSTAPVSCIHSTRVSSTQHPQKRLCYYRIHATSRQETTRNLQQPQYPRHPLVNLPWHPHFDIRIYFISVHYKSIQWAIPSLLLFSVGWFILFITSIVLGLLLTIGRWCCFCTIVELTQCSNTLFRFGLVGWETLIIRLDLACAMLLDVFENANTKGEKRLKEGCYWQLDDDYLLFFRALCECVTLLDTALVPGIRVVANAFLIHFQLKSAFRLNLSQCVVHGCRSMVRVWNQQRFLPWVASQPS